MTESEIRGIAFKILTVETASESEINFAIKHRDRFQHTNEKDVQATVDVAEMTEAPNATVVSVKPHPSAPSLAQDHLDLFKQTIPPYSRSEVAAK